MSYACRFKHYVGKPFNDNLLNTIRGRHQPNEGIIINNEILRFPVVIKNKSCTCIVVEAIIDLNQNQQDTIINFRTAKELSPILYHLDKDSGKKNGTYSPKKNYRNLHRYYEVHLCIPSPENIKTSIPAFAFDTGAHKDETSNYGGRTIRFGTKVRKEILKLIFMAKGCTCLLPEAFEMPLRKIRINDQRCYVHEIGKTDEERHARRISCSEIGNTIMSLKVVGSPISNNSDLFQVVDFSEKGIGVKDERDTLETNVLYCIELHCTAGKYSLEGTVTKKYERIVKCNDKDVTERIAVILLSNETAEYQMYSDYWQMQYTQLIADYFEKKSNQTFPPDECQNCHVS